MNKNLLAPNFIESTIRIHYEYGILKRYMYLRYDYGIYISSKKNIDTYLDYTLDITSITVWSGGQRTFQRHSNVK